MNTIYEFIDNGSHYKIFDNGTWRKKKTKIKTPFAINHFKARIDTLIARLTEEQEKIQKKVKKWIKTQGLKK